MGTARYEIRIRGRLSPSLARAFDGMQMAVKPVETILHGPVADQQELFGLLDQLQALGLQLVEVRQLAVDEPPLTADPGA